MGGGAGLGRALEPRPELEVSTRGMVRRRPTERRAQLPGSAPGIARRQESAGVGGRRWRSSGFHVFRVARGGMPVRKRAAGPGDRPRRPGGDLYADDPGGRRRDARLRQDRSGPLRRLRRIFGRQSPQQDHRRGGEAPDHGRRGTAPRQDGAAEGDLGSRTGGDALDRARGGGAPRRPGRCRRHHEGGPRSLVPRSDGGREGRMSRREHGCRRRLLHSLHLRYHGAAEGRRPHHRRVSDAGVRDHAPGLRSEGRRRLLVHRGHWLDHRAQLRGLRTARQRGDGLYLRGRAGLAGPGTAVAAGGGARRHHLLHGSDRHPRVHALGPGVAGGLRPLIAAPSGYGRGIDQPRSLDVVPRAYRGWPLPHR